MAVVEPKMIVMIIDLHRQGPTVSAIARRTGRDRKTMRPHIEHGPAAPAQGPRKPPSPLLEAFEAQLRERTKRFRELTARGLLREIRELGYEGGRTAVTGYLRQVRPTSERVFESRFETAPGRQAQLSFACFETTYRRGARNAAERPAVLQGPALRPTSSGPRAGRWTLRRNPAIVAPLRWTRARASRKRRTQLWLRTS